MSPDQQTRQTTEDDGLQVVADHIEGEEAMSVSTLPEVAIPDTPVVFFDKEKDYPETVDFDVARTAPGDSVEQNVAPVAKSWRKRRRLWVAAAAFVVIAVALGVGIGLGLSK